MRLIDADALKDSIEVHFADGVHVYDTFAELIDEQPTIEPERKKGKWIKMSDADGYYYVCDQCGENLPRYMTEPLTFDNPYPPKFSIDKTNFCPNCGAAMIGEQNG